MAEALIKLPPPNLKGKKAVEEAIATRRSVRRYKAEPLSLSQLSQILWSAQGITAASRYRAIPSAGATFPLEVYTLVGEQTVTGLKAGIYRYEANSHSLRLHLDGDFRQELAEAALGQGFIATCPVDIVVCALFSRTTNRYGKRGEMYVYMEAGHLGQNVALQAVALGLATVMVGAFDDGEVSRVLRVKEQAKPLYIIPVGKSA
jgi:SagB-type dehydrogenase family enzyme